jgi:hypothetical protein
MEEDIRKIVPATRHSRVPMSRFWDMGVATLATSALAPKRQNAQ